MRYNPLYSLLFLVATSAMAQRQTVSLCGDWKFTHNDKGVNSSLSADGSWQTVSVPHDWAIAGPFDKNIDMQVVRITQNNEKVATEHTGRTGALPYIGVGWYQREVFVPQDAACVELQFDGAMASPVVFVNGKEVGHWAYGYTPFNIDISRAVKRGAKNLIAVRLENKPESSRWYPGAGIYRPVSVVFRKPTHLQTWGTVVTTERLCGKSAVVSVTANVEGANSSSAVDVDILDRSGRVVAQSRGVKPLSDGSVSTRLEVADARLWTPETPYIYSAVVSVNNGDERQDVETVKFGIRTVSVTKEHGFSLNGTTRKIKGVCLHHDLGPIGTALNKAALARQIKLLKGMGADAIRTSHNIPSQWQMELCDSLGMMVMAESFDMYKYPKMKQGYNLLFDEWADRDIEALVRAHRNHPSIVMWSIGNEIPEQGSADGARMARHLQDLCHKFDPTRPVTQGMDRVDAAVKSGFAQVMDVPGLNYRLHRYEHAYKNLSQGFILGSETASTVSSRGVYHFPVVETKDATNADIQCSGYDLGACNWSNIPDDDWAMQDDHEWVVGEFVWTGFDYLGEPTPYDAVWPSRSSYFGIFDLAGLPKDRYYLYRSHWNSRQHTLHLLPHWNWHGREGQTTPVFCYTDYPKAELFVNGVSQGVRTKDASSRLDRYRLRWMDVKYEPGTVKVVAYNDNDEVCGVDSVVTAGKPYAIKLEADRKMLTADGNDLVFVTATVVDKKGNICPTATNLLRFSVKGAAKYKCACNGDASSLEPFVAPQMHAFAGQLVMVAEAKSQKGRATLTVTSKGLRQATLAINVE
ncbi:MAG: DUF4982 domain-containing protein [Bacteroidaceae bacterium]|nr:DUF4982 domain-containing protein [Bacteroidaceae bacterium]